MYIRNAKETKDLMTNLDTFRDLAVAHFDKLDEYDVIDTYVLDLLLSPQHICHVYPLDYIVKVVTVTAENYHADEQKVISSVRKLRRAGVLHSQKAGMDGRVWYGANLEDRNV